MQPMHGLNELREQGRMTWIEAERGWGAEPEDIVEALSKDGFHNVLRLGAPPALQIGRAHV